MNFANQYNQVKTIIHKLGEKYGIYNEKISLLVVTKKQNIEKIQHLYDIGARDFAENKVQEALTKITELKLKEANWHFIGNVQTNKCNKIANHFSWVHSIASYKVAATLNKYATKKINVCIQVNVDAEPQKLGISIEETENLAQQIMSLDKLKLRGLMCLPKASVDFKQQCTSFAKLKTLYIDLNNKGFNLDTLSMGTSQDMEAAIANGATIVRIGRAIFSN